MRRLKRYICLVGLLALLAAAVLLGTLLWAVTRSNAKAEQAAGAAAANGGGVHRPDPRAGGTDHTGL